jgi:hypothetical protein
MNQLRKTAQTACLLCMAASAGLWTGAVQASNHVMGTKAGQENTVRGQALPYSDRQHMKAYGSDREALQARLKSGMDAASYRQQLTDMGYKITAVNDKENDYVEYEVVKGNLSHEVQIDLDKSSRKATKIEVAMNLWRADATKAALSGKPYQLAATSTTTYSDRAYAKTWNDEKDTLEKALGTGQDRGYYEQRLKALGFTVTSTNDRDKDYVEYEVVKGNRTYEVQIDFDNGSRRATEVDVTTNMWNSEATERALAAGK